MSAFRAAWEASERQLPRPSSARDLIVRPYDAFAEDVRNHSPDFVERVVASLYAGDIYILKRAFSADWMAELQRKVVAFWRSAPSSFHQMLEGCPDFHRIQDDEAAKRYAFESVRHSYYCFWWNGDPLGILPEIMARWRICKFLGGLPEDAYERNTPKDGVVDRVQVVRYPPGVGRSETHADPYQNQRLFVSVFPTKRGQGYTRGGFYVLGQDDKPIDVEPLIEVGDLALGYATVRHGVARIDPGVACDWDATDGRWWLGMFSNSSDMVKERAVGMKTPVKEVKPMEPKEPNTDWDADAGCR